MRVPLLPALGLVVLLAGEAAAIAPGDYLRTLEFDGLTRSYGVHVPPSYDGTKPVPLVLDFHGLNSNGAQQAFISGMNVVSDSAGGAFIVSHPEGVNHAWNAGTCCGNRDLDDVGFIRAVVAAIEAEANIDTTRVYATGLSNGGAISQRLACDAADLFAAAAPMAFPIPAKPLSTCQPSRAIPVLTFMGLTDVLVPYNGGGFGFGSAPDTFAYWHDVDGCSGTTPDKTDAKGASRCEIYTHCQAGVQAGLCSITANSFNGLPFDGHILYLNPDYKLASVAWAFLSQFQLPAAVAPKHAALAGAAKAKVGHKGHSLGTVTWNVTLGGSTWSADAGGEPLTGSWVRHGKKKVVLTLTGDSRTALLGSLASQAADVVGSAVTVDMTAAHDGLVIMLDRHGTPRRLDGRFTLTGAPKRGLLTVRLKSGR